MVMKMNHNSKLLLLASLTLAIICLIYYSELMPALLKNVPLSVYGAYLDAKLTFGCAGVDCYQLLQKCESSNATVVYWLNAWHMESQGRDRFFDAAGSQICDVRVNSGDCKACQETTDKYANCPAVESCNTLLNND